MTPAALSTSTRSTWGIALLAMGVGMVCVGCAPDRPEERIVRPGERTESDGAGSDDNARTTTAAGSHADPQRQPGELREPVAVIDGETVTRGDFEKRLSMLPEYARVRYRTLKSKQALLETVIHTEAMADLAERRELGSSTEARYAMQHELARQTHENAIARSTSMEEIDDDDIESYFETHRDEFHHPERRRMAVVMTGTKTRAEALRREFLQDHPPSSAAEANPDATTQKRIEAFRRLAATRSIHRDLLQRAGDPGLLFPPNHTRSDDRDDQSSRVGSAETRRRWAEIAFDLEEPGALSTPFACGGTTNGERDDASRWCVAMLLQILDAERPSHEDLAREIRSKLYNQRVEALRTNLLERWRSEADVRILENQDDPSWQQRTETTAEQPTSLEDIPLREVDPNESNAQ